MRFLRLAVFFSTFVFAAVARAQSVHWQSGDSAFGNSIQLVFEDCEPDGEPQLPPIPNATLNLEGNTTSVNIVNLNVTRSMILTYSVQARRGGPLQIPGFTVKTNKGVLRVPAFNAAGPSITADTVATSHLVPERKSVWAGEVFDLDYKIDAARRNNPQFDPSFAFDWTPAPLIAEEWSKPAISETSSDDQRHVVLTYQTRAYAKTPGKVTLQAARQLVHVQTGAIGFGLFSQARMEPITITSDQPTIEVRPLPAPPAGFTGAVGTFKLTSKVVPTSAGVGEPVTWTLELSGTGNWPDIPGLPAREVSKDFQVIQPKAKRTPADGKLFDATLSEDVVLIPTKAGSYTLGPVAFTFFNPKNGSYETVHTDQTTITITAPAAASPFAGGNVTTPAAGESTGSAAKPAVVPGAPAGIPRDPLPGHAAAAVPMSTAALAVWLVAPLVALLLFWLALAWRAAVRTDPHRPQREAHARLAALLASVRGRTPAPAALLQWQHDAAVLWRVRHAAPGPDAVGAALGGASAAATAATPAAAEWVTLWRESDRALYGRQVALPSDWVARAEAALAAQPAPRFKPARLFLPQNLLAFAAAVALLLLLALPSRAHAAEPAPDAAYRAGNFAAAENAWRADVAKAPTDWVARHNLSLALAQEDKTGEAAAQAAAAFVQDPGDNAVKWHFALMAQKAGFAPAPLAVFLKEGPAADIASLASPAVWQVLLIVAAFVVAASLGWLLYNGYGSRSRRQGRAAVAVGALAFIAGATCLFGLGTYGETADRRAVVTWQPGTLRSIPTEADTTQKTTALPAGSVAIMTKTFLGWDRLDFSNGQTGWVRKEDVIPLWSK